MSPIEEHSRYLDACCEALGVQLHDVLNHARNVQHTVRARQAITWAMRERFSISWVKLGKLMHRDHSTVMYSGGQFAKALHAGADWASGMHGRLLYQSAPLAGLESAQDTLRRCSGIDLADALELEAAG